jgi:hypothetical protein
MIIQPSRGNITNIMIACWRCCLPRALQSCRGGVGVHQQRTVCTKRAWRTVLDSAWKGCGSVHTLGSG